MKIRPGILIIKGNFTQRQFDSLTGIWADLQKQNKEDSTELSLPALQLSENGEIEILQVNSKGVFHSSKHCCGCNCKD